VRARRPRLGAIEDHRQLDVLHRCQVGDEIARRLLPDEADLLAPVGDEVGWGHRQQVAPADEGAAGAGHVEAGEDVQERRLARARGADDRHQLAAAHLEVEAAQRDDLEVFQLVDLEEVFAEDVGLALCRPSRRPRLHELSRHPVAAN